MHAFNLIFNLNKFVIQYAVWKKLSHEALLSRVFIRECLSRDIVARGGIYVSRSISHIVCDIYLQVARLVARRCSATIDTRYLHNNNYVCKLAISSCRLNRQSLLQLEIVTWIVLLAWQALSSEDACRFVFPNGNSVVKREHIDFHWVIPWNTSHRDHKN